MCPSVRKDSQLDDAPAEEVELAEEQRVGEVELLALGHLLQLALRQPVLLLYCKEKQHGQEWAQVW